MDTGSPTPIPTDDDRRIHWRPWGATAFQEALRDGRPVLLSLTATWCGWCRRLDRTTFAEPDLVRLVNRELVPIRVDTDRYPHVQDRYLAGGWPTNAFLTPTGEVLWAGTYVEPDEFRRVAHGVLTAWNERSAELELEIQRRRRALEAARARHPIVGLVRREAADDVLTATVDAFDPRNGGFGTEPKFPHPEAVELLYVEGARVPDDEWVAMADHTLDGMLAGELMDPVDGGFFRYALGADWTRPRTEKLLELNAGLLRAYAFGAARRGRDDWRAAAERTVRWADETLRLPDGLWGGSQAADDEYYALDPAARRERSAPPADPTVLADANAAWIAALADAGGLLGRDDWVATAAEALEILLATMAAPGDLLYHFRPPGGEPALARLLTDPLEAAAACLAVARRTGRELFFDHARRLTAALERTFWDDDGAFLDHALAGEGDVAALRYRDRPFEPNARAARFLVALSLETGERSYLALAERVLAVLSPLAGRYGVAGAAFPLAVEEFYRARGRAPRPPAR